MGIAEYFGAASPASAAAVAVPLQYHVISPDAVWRTARVGALRAVGARANGHVDMESAAPALSDLFDNLLLISAPGTPLADGLIGEVRRQVPPASRDLCHVALALHQPTPEDVVDAVRAGAVDVLSRDGAAAEGAARLLATSRCLAEQRTRISAAQSGEASIGLLSPRERDVLERLARGDRTKQIAHALDLSPRTVEMHCARLRRRLGVASLGQAVGLWMQAQAA